MKRAEQLRPHADIYTLPLSQLSIEHGTGGLEARLQHALAQLGLADNQLIQQSLGLGLELHREDARTYEPYNNHLLRVTLRLIEELGVVDLATIAAAPLHDSVEDHPEELIRRFLGIEVPGDPHRLREFGYKALVSFATQYHTSEVAGIVLAVSNPILEPGDDKNKAYIEHTSRLALRGTPKSEALKVADFTDNVEAHEGLEESQKRSGLDRKQIGVYGLHVAGLTRPDSLVVGLAREKAVETLSRRRSQALERLGRVA